MSCANCGEFACTTPNDAACTARGAIRDKKLASIHGVSEEIANKADDIETLCVTLRMKDGSVRTLVPAGVDPTFIIGLLDLSQQVCRNMLTGGGKPDDGPPRPNLRIVTP